MKDIEFIQYINNNDLISYNYFLAKFNKRLTINMKLIGFVCIGFGVYTLFVDLTQWYYSALLFVLGIFSIFLILPFYHLLIKLRVRKRKDTLDPIKVSFGQAGLTYTFIDENKEEEQETSEPKENEDTNKVQIISWDQITRAIRENNYIYIFLTNMVVLFVKYDSCLEQAELEDLFIEKLGLNQRYFNQKNHFIFNKKK